MSSSINNDSSKSFELLDNNFNKNYNFLCGNCENSSHESIENSIKSILESEASISECAAKIFCYIVPREFDKISDIQKKVDIFTSLLIAYNKRTSSLGKLLNSQSDIEYIPNPHIDIFDSDNDENYNPNTQTKDTNTNLTNTKKQSKSYEELLNSVSLDNSVNYSFIDNKNQSNNSCKQNHPKCKESPYDCDSKKTSCNTVCKAPSSSYAKQICSNIYFLEKVQIFYTCNNMHITYDMYYNCTNSKIFFVKATNPNGFSHTYIIN